MPLALGLCDFKLALCFIDPLDSPAPVIAGLSNPRTPVEFLSFFGLDSLPYLESLVDAGRCEEPATRREADTRHIVLAGINCGFVSSLQIVYCDFVSVGTDSHSGDSLLKPRPHSTLNYR